MIAADVLTALTPVVNAFEALHIPYLIGGSIASSVYGVARSTLDADLMADVQPAQVSDLVARLGDAYYLSEPAIRDSLARRSSFNLIHLDTMVKLDIFIPKGEPFDQSALGRRQSLALDRADPRPFQLNSPEDIILLKLDWFRQANAESEKQWRDILGVLRVQATSLDRDYLTRWAARLDLTTLLAKALADADLS